MSVPYYRRGPAASRAALARTSHPALHDARTAVEKPLLPMTPVNRGGQTSAAYVPSENPEVFLQLPQHQQRMQEAFMDIGTFPAMLSPNPGPQLLRQRCRPFAGPTSMQPVAGRLTGVFAHSRNYTPITASRHNLYGMFNRCSEILTSREN